MTLVNNDTFPRSQDPQARLTDSRENQSHSQQPLHAFAVVSKSGLAQGATLCKLSEIRPPSSVDTEMVVEARS